MENRQATSPLLLSQGLLWLESDSHCDPQPDKTNTCNETKPDKLYIYIYGHTVIQDVVYLLSAQCELQRSELWHAQMSSIVCQPGLQILENWSHWVFQMFYLFFIWFFQMSIAL